MKLFSYDVFLENKSLIERKKPWIFDGDFDVTSDMIIDSKMIKEKIPDEVTGSFECSDLRLTTLEGCPSSVGGYFSCSNNKLTSLEGCPSIVGGDFYCDLNKLTTLKGGPIKVNGDFKCRYNKLTSLEGSPIRIGGSFSCYSNKLDLTIEKYFILSGKYYSQSTYWQDLLQYMIDEKINLTEINTWPDEFIKTLDDQYKNIFKSHKSINKFKL